MSDMSGHDATERDTLHTLTLRDLETLVAAAGVLISRRQLMRHCEAGTFDAQKLPATNNVLEWFIAPASVEKGLADIRTLQEQRARRDASRRDAPGHNALEMALETDPDVTGHVATRLDVSDAEKNDPSNPVMAEHVPSRRDVSAPQPSQNGEIDFDIFEHAYVKRLENQVEKWEGKYHEQVRRTEEIQMKGTQQILELQRMTAIGQSETLADFMLKAKEWILGEGAARQEKSGAGESAAT
jgi:hypothetical protein